MTVERDLQDDDKAFDRQLHQWYRQALLTEAFQQQVAEDLQQLPQEGKSALGAKHQAFIDPPTLSTQSYQRLLDLMPDCGAVTKPAKAPPQSWWQRLFSRRWNESRLPGPGLSLPLTLVAGIVLGVALPSLLTLLHPQPVTWRGTNTQVSETPSTASITLSPAIKQNPAQWLNAIADLLKQGRVEQATTELDEFRLRYPNYQPSSSPP